MPLNYEGIAEALPLLLASGLGNKADTGTRTLAALELGNQNRIREQETQQGKNLANAGRELMAMNPESLTPEIVAEVGKKHGADPMAMFDMMKQFSDFRQDKQEWMFKQREKEQAAVEQQQQLALQQQRSEWLSGAPNPMTDPEGYNAHLVAGVREGYVDPPSFQSPPPPTEAPKFSEPEVLRNDMGAIPAGSVVQRGKDGSLKIVKEATPKKEYTQILDKISKINQAIAELDATGGISPMTLSLLGPEGAQLVQAAANSGGKKGAIRALKDELSYYEALRNDFRRKAAGLPAPQSGGGGQGVEIDPVTRSVMDGILGTQTRGLSFGENAAAGSILPPASVGATPTGPLPLAGDGGGPVPKRNRGESIADYLKRAGGK